MGFNYNYQSYTDILGDLDKWLGFSDMLEKKFESSYAGLKKSDFYAKVPKNLQTSLDKTPDFIGRVSADINSIKVKIVEGAGTLDDKDSKILEKLSNDATRLKDQLVDGFDKSQDWKEFSDPNFKTVKDLFIESKGYLIAICTCGDAAAKLKVFLNSPLAEKAYQSASEDTGKKKKK